MDSAQVPEVTPTPNEARAGLSSILFCGRNRSGQLMKKWPRVRMLSLE